MVGKGQDLLALQAIFQDQLPGAVIQKPSLLQTAAGLQRRAFAALEKGRSRQGFGDGLLRKGVMGAAQHQSIQPSPVWAEKLLDKSIHFSGSRFAAFHQLR